MKRYLLKLSGEALIGKYNYGIDPDIVNDISSNIVEVNKTKNQLAVVVGGGAVGKTTKRCSNRHRPPRPQQPANHLRASVRKI